jgi:hypothetical protein
MARCWSVKHFRARFWACIHSPFVKEAEAQHKLTEKHRRRGLDHGAAPPTLVARPMAYNREAAVGYAAMNWFSPCDDGTISMINEPTLVVAKERRRLDATGIAATIRMSGARQLG